MWTNQNKERKGKQAQKPIHIADEIFHYFTMISAHDTYSSICFSGQSFTVEVKKIPEYFYYFSDKAYDS